MSIASVVRRGYVDTVPSVVLRGYSMPAGAPARVGDVPTLRMVKDRPAYTFDLSAIFSGVGISYAIAPAVEAEASFNTTTGVLTWNPLNAGTFGPYTVTATNSSGATDSNAFSVIVQLTAPAVAAFDLGLGYKLRISL